MKYRTGTVKINDNQGNILLERTLAEDYRFVADITMPKQSCFFSFKPENAEDVDACMQKAVKWGLEKKPLALVFGACNFFSEGIVQRTVYDAEADCVRIEMIGRFLC